MKSVFTGIAAAVLFLIPPLVGVWIGYKGYPVGGGLQVAAIVIWILGAALFGSIDVTGPLPREDVVAFIAFARFGTYIGASFLLTWLSRILGAWLAR